VEGLRAGGPRSRRARVGCHSPDHTPRQARRRPCAVARLPATVHQDASRVPPRLTPTSAREFAAGTAETCRERRSSHSIYVAQS